MDKRNEIIDEELSHQKYLKLAKNKALREISETDDAIFLRKLEQPKKDYLPFIITIVALIPAILDKIPAILKALGF